ncbi:hypothetical protein BTE77_35600 [Ensifer adhaerens]|nr:hypothetical protein BTE77_35600 [Ensifer adhaerens]
MMMKSVLLASAAALVAVSSAQAADAIVAAEPEPMEYVRVCDAFGTGYFYIPGTETCLKIGGYVRFQTSFGSETFSFVEDRNDPEWYRTSNEVQKHGSSEGTSDWDSFSRAYVSFDAKSDTEYGTLTGFFAAEFNADNDAGGDSFIDVDEAYIQLGGLKAGFFYSWWDKGLNGETDDIGENTEFNSISYLYDAGTWSAGIAIDELEGVTAKSNGLGVEGIVSASFGGVSFDLLGGYDSEVEEGAIRGLISANVGPGVLQAAAIWSSDPNAYWSASEWSVAASYRWNATEKLAITPGAQYFGSLRQFPYAFNQGYSGIVNWGGVGDLGNGWGNGDAWKIGLTADYQITEGLALRTTVDYTAVDYGSVNIGGENFELGDDNRVSGFVRLQRNF